MRLGTVVPAKLLAKPGSARRPTNPSETKQKAWIWLYSS
jgi:hypothetical protein